jgi:hypothetical protein
MSLFKQKKQPILLNQFVPESLRCSYCGCILVAGQFADGTWGYRHDVLPMPSTSGCLNAGKCFKANLTTLEER